MAPEKEKPMVETVQEGLKLSDLLMVEVCNPIKDKIDGTKLCLPSFPGGGKPWSPIKLCSPMKLCSPVIPCTPIIVSHLCGPTFQLEPSSGVSVGPSHAGACGPLACGPGPVSFGQKWGEDYREMLQAELAQKLTVTELNNLREEVTALKKEITALKNQPKR